MTPLTDPTPIDETPQAVPVCRHHADLLHKIDGIETKVDSLTGKVDLVLEALIPRPVGDTLSGRIVALASQVVADSVARKILTLAILALALAVGGAASADVIVRYLAQEAPERAAEASGDASTPATSAVETGNDEEDRTKPE